MSQDLARCGESRLWAAVLGVALIDALPAYPTRQGLTGAPEAGVDLLRLDRARAWLRLANPDFREVCELAGRDPDQVFRYFQLHHTPRDQLVVRTQAQIRKKRSVV